ncbi:DUF2871 domain-containing protein [Streptomyces sp. NPDC059917]|uniref:DUF2871 domain-containing protein n=1 Tax=Streptomyces sp. NPDC059917 TaxID=3347002 RepID=UPI00366292F5
MRKTFYAAHVYMIIGVISGLYYRELTKAYDFTGETQLAVVHTHLLALGMLGLLIVLGLDKVFSLSGTKHFDYFFWFYNAGIAITCASMTYRGTQTVLGHKVPELFSLVGGLGHIILTVGLILLFTLLGKRVKEHVEGEAAEAAARATLPGQAAGSTESGKVSG